MHRIALYAALLSSKVVADDYFHGDGTAYTLGETSSGNCNMMDALASSDQNYAALNDQQWDNLHHCGRCAEVSCDDDKCPDTSITQVVQILDRCPECKFGDLDLSPTVFTKITGHGPSRLKVKWKFVDCPVKGNIKYCLKNGSNNFWTAIQPTNVISGVKSMQINGQETKMVDSAYYYLLDGGSRIQNDLSNLKVTLTSVNGEKIEDVVALSVGDCSEGTKQFSAGLGGGISSTPSFDVPTSTSKVDTPPLIISTAIPKIVEPATTTPSPSPISPAHQVDEEKSVENSSTSEDAVGEAIEIIAPTTTKTTIPFLPTTTVQSIPKIQKDETIEEVSVKANNEGNGTSWVLAISGGIVFCGVGILIVLAIYVHKKRSDDKDADEFASERFSVISINRYNSVATPARTPHSVFGSNASSSGYEGRQLAFATL